MNADENGLLTIGAAAKRAGVSVRTLRHYDHIGLLSPSRVTRAGYRLYDAAAMRRLERILFFRELDFPLEEICAILSHPDFDEKNAMRRQLTLLKQERRRLDGLIARLDAAIHGDGEPRFEVFNMKEIENMKREYAEEAKRRWGAGDAYAQSERNHLAYTKADYAAMQAEMNGLMERFAAVRDLPPQEKSVRQLAEEWQAHITKWHYECTDEILSGLGQMYAADERFMRSIDRHGQGTAACMSRAIAAYLAAKGA